MRKGFTLIEMLTVVLIISVLTGLAVPQYRRAIQKAQATEAIAMMRTLYDSSERLAAEMGYRSYEHLYNATYKTNQKKSGIARMDMFGSGQTPKGCTLSGANKYELQCKKYNYDVAYGSGRYVKATKKTAPYKNTVLLFNRNTLNLSCVNPVGESRVCDMLGIDLSTGVAS